MKMKAMNPMQCCIRDPKQDLIVSRLRQAAGQLTAAHLVMPETNAQLKVGPKARHQAQCRLPDVALEASFVFVFVSVLPCSGEASGTWSPHSVLTPAEGIFLTPGNVDVTPLASISAEGAQATTLRQLSAAQPGWRRQVHTSACSGSNGAAAFWRQATSTNVCPVSVLTRVSTVLSCCLAEKARTSASSRACRWVHPRAGGGLIRTEGPVGSHCATSVMQCQLRWRRQRALCRHQALVTLLVELSHWSCPSLCQGGSVVTSWSAAYSYL